MNTTENKLNVAYCNGVTTRGNRTDFITGKKIPSGVPANRIITPAFNNGKSTVLTAENAFGDAVTIKTSDNGKTADITLTVISKRSLDFAIVLYARYNGFSVSKSKNNITSFKAVKIRRHGLVNMIQTLTNSYNDSNKAVTITATTENRQGELENVKNVTFSAFKVWFNKMTRANGQTRAVETVKRTDKKKRKDNNEEPLNA